MDFKDLTKSLVAVIVVGGAIVSLFVPVVNETSSEVLRFLAGTVVGYYFGVSAVPKFGLGKK